MSMLLGPDSTTTMSVSPRLWARAGRVSASSASIVSVNNLGARIITFLPWNSMRLDERSAQRRREPPGTMAPRTVAPFPFQRGGTMTELERAVERSVEYAVFGGP